MLNKRFIVGLLFLHHPITAGIVLTCVPHTLFPLIAFLICDVAVSDDIDSTRNSAPNAHVSKDEKIQCSRTMAAAGPVCSKHG